MFPVYLRDNCSASMETRDSPEDTADEMDTEHFIYMQRLLPSRSAVLKDKYDTMDNLASILPYATLRMRNTSLLPTEEHANAITSRLKLNTMLIRDDPISQKLRIKTLKAMPQCLTVKRSVKSKLEATVSQKPMTESLGYWKWLRYKTSFTLMKMRTTIQDVMLSIELWSHTIKSIEGQCGSGIATYFKFLRWLILLNTVSCILSILFIVTPQSLHKTHLESNISAWDFLTGSGFFENTIMYYGFYANSTVQSAFDSRYSIPYAYFMTLLLCYILTFVILSIKVVSSYRKCYIDVQGTVQNMYSNKIFCGWDFNICSSKAAKLHAASIYTELEELLSEDEQYASPRCWDKFLIILIQIIVTVIILGLLCGTVVLLWFLLNRYEMDRSNPLSLMIVPIVITIIMRIFPAIISWLAILERYNRKRTELYVTVIRAHGMGATIITTLLVFRLINSKSDCWQTQLGEEIYRLILLDFIVTTMTVCVAETTRFALYNLVWRRIGKSEFDIARSTLNLIYNQTLFWLGYYFSPLMSVIIVVKMILIFHVKRHGILRYYKAPSRPWRAAQTQTLFLALAFLDGVLSLRRDSAFWRVVTEITNPAIGAAILIGMSIGLYWMRARADASKEMLQILKEMLLLQSRDKQFLIKSLSRISDERRYMHEKDVVPSSSVRFVTKEDNLVPSTSDSDGFSQDTRHRNNVTPGYDDGSS
ncbi:hypothetical protein KM043_011324 [Ampulex compressa]|nr:hypothetical protein KM043_011324 [Ampulex compressa]